MEVVYPGELLVDLEGYYDVSRITVIPYYGGSRYYHYEVYVSDDGFTYDLVGRKDSDEPQTSEGETYEFRFADSKIRKGRHDI